MKGRTFKVIAWLCTFKQCWTCVAGCSSHLLLACLLSLSNSICCSSSYLLRVMCLRTAGFTASTGNVRPVFDLTCMPCNQLLACMGSLNTFVFTIELLLSMCIRCMHRGRIACCRTASSITMQWKVHAATTKCIVLPATLFTATNKVVQQYHTSGTTAVHHLRRQCIGCIRQWQLHIATRASSFWSAM